MFRVLLTLAAASLSAAALAAQPAPTVSTTLGQAAGVRQGDSQAFLGLPYAKPPVGDLRWRPPAKPEPWSGVRDASRFSANCIQPAPRRFGPYTPEFLVDAATNSEDCLYLNVWAPAARGQGLPVLVWIHGGGFSGGSGSIPIYNGARLAAKGAVVVTINYRLGALGFMAHPALTAESPRQTSGNYGLLDMIAALQWVQANAAKFGGDPAKVTIAGQSAGAMAINALLHSPEARGLFAGAVAQSGTAAGGAVTHPLATAEAEGGKLAAKLGASTLQALRAAPADAVLVASAAGPPLPGLPPPLRMIPTVDGKVVVGDPNDPTAAPAVRAPLMSGYNRDEGRGVTLGRSVTPAEFQTTVRARYGALADRVLGAYPHATPAEASASAALLPRDMVTVTLATWSQVRSQRAGHSAYAYLYEHPYPGPEAAAFGTFHTSEVPYLFGVLDQQGRPFTAEDRRISDQIQAYWLNFMRTGDPNGAGLPRWAATRGGASEVMWLGDRAEMRPAASTPARLALLSEVVANQGYTAFLGN